MKQRIHLILKSYKTLAFKYWLQRSTVVRFKLCNGGWGWGAKKERSLILCSCIYIGFLSAPFNHVCCSFTTSWLYEVLISGMCSFHLCYLFYWLIILIISTCKLETNKLPYAVIHDYAWIDNIVKDIVPEIYYRLTLNFAQIAHLPDLSRLTYDPENFKLHNEHKEDLDLAGLRNTSLLLLFHTHSLSFPLISTLLTHFGHPPSVLKLLASCVFEPYSAFGHNFSSPWIDGLVN